MRERALPITVNGIETEIVLNKRKFRAAVMNQWESMRFMNGEKIASAKVGDYKIKLLVEGRKRIRDEIAELTYDDIDNDIIEEMYDSGQIDEMVILKRNGFMLSVTKKMFYPDGSEYQGFFAERPYTERTRNEKEFSEIFARKAESLIKEIEEA